MPGVGSSSCALFLSFHLPAWSDMPAVVAQYEQIDSVSSEFCPDAKLSMSSTFKATAVLNVVPGTIFQSLTHSLSPQGYAFIYLFILIS